jgi:hypothetical protein
MAIGLQSVQQPKAEHFDPVQSIQLVQWKEMIKTGRQKGISGEIRKFDDELDDDDRNMAGRGDGATQGKRKGQRFRFPRVGNESEEAARYSMN